NYDDRPDGYPAASAAPSAWLVRIWSLRDRRAVRTLRGHRGFVRSIEWSRSGKLLATASVDGTVRVWKTDTWRPVVTLRETFPYMGKGDHVTARQARFSPDGKTLAVVSVASYQGEPGSVITRVVLWDTQSWKGGCMLMNETWTFDAAIAFWPNRKRLLAPTA